MALITGLTAKTFKNLQLNEGAFLFDFDLTTYTDATAVATAVAAALKAGTKVLGATVGGGSFSAEPSIREIEVDGLRYPFVGSTVNDMWTIKLSGTAKEVNAENFARFLATCDKDTSKANVTKLTVRTEIKASDYIPKLCWVGSTSEEGVCVIELENVLNTSGVTLTFQDKGEGSIPFEFQAHCADIESQDKAPFAIYFFTKAS